MHFEARERVNGPVLQRPDQTEQDMFQIVAVEMDLDRFEQFCCSTDGWAIPIFVWHVVQ